MTASRTTIFDHVLEWIGHRLAGKLNEPSPGYLPFTPSDFDLLTRILRPGDVLLVEGRDRVSNAIKYLTQSTWSHVAIHVGPRFADPSHVLVEVNLGEGCVSVPLTKYARYNTRVCRPVGLTAEECAAVTDFMIAHIGLQYDLRNIWDMLRYLLPNPPVPVRWRRRMLAFGSGDPTRAICSSLIAQAFQTVRYPILPDVRQVKARAGSGFAQAEILHIRHHSLYAPRDFDLSPWFQIVKPTLVRGFDPHKLVWDTALDDTGAQTGSQGEAHPKASQPCRQRKPVVSAQAAAKISASVGKAAGHRQKAAKIAMVSAPSVSPPR